MRLLILFVLMLVLASTRGLAIAQDLISVNRTELLQTCRDSIELSRELVQQLSRIIVQQKRFQNLYFNRIMAIQKHCLEFPNNC